MRGTNSRNERNEKIRQKITMGLKSRDPQKALLGHLLPNFNFLAQFGVELGEEQHFFEIKMGGGNPISALLIDLGD